MIVKEKMFLTLKGIQMSNNITKLLNNINKTDPLFVDILLERENISNDQKAFTFVSGSGSETLSYSQLNKRIKSLAAYLQQSGLKGERALLLYPPGFDYIIGYFACLFAGVIAVPVYPPEETRMEKTLPRLEAIAKDSNAKIALSTVEIKNQVEEWRKNLKLNNVQTIENSTTSEFLFRLKDILDISWIATDDFKDEIDEQWIYNEAKDTDIAYLQYTSGSTGVPKGVMISHKNLVHNTGVIFNGFELDRDEFEGVLWLPIYHDMGLIGGILTPLLSGYHTTLLSPIDFLKRPLRWLQLISDKKDVQIASGGPNFAYDLCIRGTTPQRRAELDLSNWRLAFTGAEPVRAETMNEFAKVFEVSGFKKSAINPCYGLAEGTLMVSASRNDKGMVINSFLKEELKNNRAVIGKDDNNEDLIKLVSSGRKTHKGEVRIVNPETHEVCKDGDIGEIWSQTESNASGYWKKSELSDEIFNAHTADTKEGPFLRTGDLGFLLGGNLYITGRLKDLIIIRGTNHYPQDIEFTAENSNKLLRAGSIAAFAIEKDNEEKLVIVIEARAKKDVDWLNVVKDIKDSVLKSHNIIADTIVLIKPRTIFKTSSGKIRRNATKQAFFDNTLEVIFDSRNSSSQIVDNNQENEKIETPKQTVVANSGEIVNLLVEKLSEELKISKNEIDLNAPFTSFGLDSAKSVQLVGQLEEIVGKELEATILWNYPSINKLADFLSNNNVQASQESISEKKSDSDLTDEDINKMTDEEAEALLLKKLNSDDLDI